MERKKKKKKYNYAFVWMSFWILFVSGCYLIEPERRAYPLVVGIDYEGEEYKVCFALAQLSQTTGQEKSGGEEPDRGQILLGKSKQEIEKKYNQSEELYLDLGHVQAVIFGKKLLADSEVFNKVLCDLEKETTLGTSAYVFQTENVEEVIGWNGKKVSSLGDYLSGLYENRIHKKEGIALSDLYHQFHNAQTLDKIPEIVPSNYKFAAA